MCTFTFLYSDGSKIKCEHIKSAAYSSGNRLEVSEQNLATLFSLWEKFYGFLQKAEVSV